MATPRVLFRDPIMSKGFDAIMYGRCLRSLRQRCRFFLSKTAPLKLAALLRAQPFYQSRTVPLLLSKTAPDPRGPARTFAV